VTNMPEAAPGRAASACQAVQSLNETPEPKGNSSMTNTAGVDRPVWPLNHVKFNRAYVDVQDLEFIRLFDRAEPTEPLMFGLCGSCGEDGVAWRAVATNEQGDGLLVCGDCLELAGVMCECCEDALIEVRGVVEWKEDRPEREWNVCTTCRGHIDEGP
jgi:hypothetical protein